MHELIKLSSVKIGEQERHFTVPVRISQLNTFLFYNPLTRRVLFFTIDYGNIFYLRDWLGEYDGSQRTG